MVPQSAMDDGGQISGNEEDRVYIRCDHPAPRRLGEHKPPTDPAREGGQSHPETEGKKEDHLDKHVLRPVNGVL